MSCPHLFVNVGCAECAADPDKPFATPELVIALQMGNLDESRSTIQTQKLELAKVRDAFEDAVALLRDWEDYDPDDPRCEWKGRRDEFLSEHEESGR